MVDYSERLGASMKQAGMSVARLASRLGISYQAVKKVVDGKSRAFSAENNARAAALLDVNPDWLATGKGEMSQRHEEKAQIAPHLLPGLIPENLSKEALDLAVHFDMLTNEIDRNEAYVAALRLFMETLGDRMLKDKELSVGRPISGQSQSVPAEKLPA